MQRWMIALVMLCATVAFAEEPGGREAETIHAPTTAAHTEAEIKSDEQVAHPVLSQDPIWAGSVVILIVTMFVAAWFVAWSNRNNAPDEIPEEAHGHGSHGHNSHGH